MLRSLRKKSQKCLKVILRPSRKISEKCFEKFRKEIKKC